MPHFKFVIISSHIWTGTFYFPHSPLSHPDLPLCLLPKINFFPLLNRTVANTFWCATPSSCDSYGLWASIWLICTYQWIHTLCVLLWLAYLTQNDNLKFHPFAWEFHEVTVFNSWVVLYCVNLSHFQYSFLCWKISGLFQLLDIINKSIIFWLL